MIIINTVIGRRQGPEFRQIGLHRQPHANVQLPEAATASNLAGGLRKWAIRIRMARETWYINRIQIGRVARYKNRILFGSNGTVFHVYIIALGRPYIMGRWDCSMWNHWVELSMLYLLLMFGTSSWDVTKAKVNKQLHFSQEKYSEEPSWMNLPSSHSWMLSNTRHIS